jgi:hypothetical protein
LRRLLALLLSLLQFRVLGKNGRLAAKAWGRASWSPYYFCSAGCRTKFLENPQKYLEPETVKSAAESLPEGTVATYGKTPG